MKRSHIKFLACTLIIAMTLSVCSGALAIKEDGKLDISGDILFWNTNAGAGGRDEVFAQLAKNFMDMHPGVTVTVENFPATEIVTKLQLAASSGDLPDSMHLNVAHQSILFGLDELVPFDDYLPYSESYDGVLPALHEINRSYWPDGKLYGMPCNAQLQLLWYRSDLFEAPATWLDFYELVESKYDPDNDTYGYIIRGADNAEVTLILGYAYSGITEFFTEDGKCTLNDPLHVEFFDKYFGMYNVYTAESDITASFKDMTIAFGSGSALMFAHNTGSYSDHMKNLGSGNFAATTFPTGPSGEIVVPDLGFPSYVMCKKDDANYDATFAFIDYLISAEAQSYYHQKVGTVPVATACFDEDWAKERTHYDLVRDTLLTAKTVAFPVYLPDFSSIMAQIAMPRIQEIMFGTTTAQVMLDETAHAFEVAYAEYLADIEK